MNDLHSENETDLYGVGYGQHQAHHSHRSGTGKRKRGEGSYKGPPSRGQTIDKRNDSTRLILECSHRMRDSAAVLRDCMGKLEDDNEDVRRAALDTIKTSVLPFLDNGWQVARSAAIANSSMGAIGVAHDRIARREQKAVVVPEAQCKKSPAVQMLEHSSFKFADILAKAKAKAMKAHGKSGSWNEAPHPPHPAEEKSPPVCPEPEPPMNGKEYTKMETVVQLRKTKVGTAERKEMMTKIMTLGYVPVKERALQRVMERDAKGEQVENSPWSSVGYPPLLSTEDMEEFVRNLELSSTNPNFTFDEESVKSFIKTGWEVARNGANTTSSLATSLQTKKSPSPGLDPPTNGTEYTKLETVVQLRKTRIGSVERKEMMTKMIELGYVPIRHRALQRLMEKDAKGEQIGNTPWNTSGGGQPRLSSADFDTFVRNLEMSNKRFTFDEETIKSFMKSGWEVARKGMVPTSSITSANMAHYSIARKERKVAPKKKSPASPPPDLDPPVNGTEYTRIETVIQLRKTGLASAERKAMMTKMIDLGYVPVNIRALQRIMQSDAKGEPIGNVPWSSVGCPPLLSVDDIDEFVRNLGTSNDKFTFDKESIKAFIISKKEARMRSNGMELTEDLVTVNDTTVRNYMAIIANHPEMHVVTTAPSRRTTVLLTHKGN